MQKYTPIFSIDKKTDGNGTVEVIEQSKSGDKITYKITPKDGYKLDKIVIKDSNGNLIEVKDNEFIMPSSNVSIEAIFVVDNPNTSTNIYISISILLLIIGILTIKKYKSKIDFINN